MSNQERPSWQNTYMRMCLILAQRSTCVRIQTASIIVKNNVIVSVGYNGTVSKAEHCSKYWTEQYEKTYKSIYSEFNNFIKSFEFAKLHHEWSQPRELHGEMNAILQAGKHGISLKHSTMYTIYSPCINCAKCIITSGIQVVYYYMLYKRDMSGIQFLKENGIECIHYQFEK
jgi:dCMP deaminase